jgi:capsular polysaccharide transport system permease protein
MKQHPRTSRASWKIQRNVVAALIYRELMTRLSQSSYGLIGIFIEPIGTLVTFVLIFSLLRAGQQGPLDTSLSLFIGIILFTLFKEISMRALRSMQQNEAVFIYKPVRPVDAIIARALVESGLFGFLYLSFIFFNMILQQDWTIEDIPLLVVAYLCIAAIAFGIGLCLMIAGHRYQLVNKIAPIVIRPLFLTSGIFFSITSIPQPIRPWISWNPILQAVEISRHAFTSDYYLDESISLPYLLLFAGISCAAGFVAYSTNERLLIS